MKKLLHSPNVITIIFILFFVVTASKVQAGATVRTWNGTTSSDWTVGTNWVGGNAPITTEAASIPVVATNYPTIIASQSIQIVDLTVAAGATVNMTGGTLTLTHDWKNSGTFNATGGTFIVAGNGGAAPNFAAGTNNFFNVQVNAGFDPGFDNTAASTIRVAGNWTDNNTGALSVANAYTVIFNGTGSQTITTSRAANNSFSILTINKSAGTATLANAVKTAGNFSVTNGTFDPGINLLTIGGTFSSFSAGKIKVGAATFGGNYSKNPAPSAGTTVDYNGTIAQTVLIGTFNYSNLSINNTHASGAAIGGAITAANVTDIISVGDINAGSLLKTNSLAFARGVSDALIVNDGSTLNAGTTSITWGGASGTANISGTFITANAVGFSESPTTSISSTNTPAITLGTNSTVEYNALGNQAVTSRIYNNNLLLSGSGNKTFAAVTTIGHLFLTGSVVALFADGTTSTSFSLDLNGVSQVSGTWGGTISPATNINGTWFGTTTTGILNVFSGGVLGVNFSNMKAFEKGLGIEVDWVIQSGSGLDHYEVERSNDGSSFSKVGSVASLGGNSLGINYSWFDANPFSGNNLYRIRSIGLNGQIKYSNIVKVNLSRGIGAILVYPNPLVGSIFNLQLNNMEKGTYFISLFNTLGQRVFNTSVQHNGGSSTQTIDMRNNLTKGNYELKISGGHYKMTSRVIRY